MSRFDDAIAVTRVADGRYKAELDGGYRIGTAPNGGYLMAIMLNAALDGSPHPHAVSCAANFLRVGGPGTVEVFVEPRKTGRTAATFRVTLVQEDQALIDMQVTAGTLDAAAVPDVAARPPRALPPLAECTGVAAPGEQADRRDRGFADRVDMRFDPAAMGWLNGTPTGRLEGAGYFRLAEGAEDRTPDACALAVAVDALPPVVLNAGAGGWAPTVELTWHMRAVPVPGWLAVYGSGRLLSDGWFDEDVEVWDSAGRLVAQSRQIARAGRGGSVAAPPEAPAKQ